MTIAAHILPQLAPPDASRAAPAEQIRAVCVRWEISPSAIRAAAHPHPHHPLIAAMNGQAEKITRATLEWRTDRDTAAAVLKLEIGEDDIAIPIINAAPVSATTDQRGLTHLRAGDDLVLVLRGRELVYGWTTALTVHLGLPGGVYDPPVLL